MFHPYLYRYYLPWYDFEVDLSSCPVVFPNFINSFRLCSGFNFGKVNFRLISDLNFLMMDTGENMLTILSYMDMIYKVKDPFGIETSLRNFSIRKESFFSLYLGIAYRPSKLVELKLGYGVELKGFDEDVFLPLDYRDEMLISSYKKHTDKKPFDAVISSEDELSRDRRLSLKIKLEF